MRAYVFSVFFHTLSLFVFFVFSFGSFIPLSSSLSTFRSTYPRREVFCRIVYVCNSRCYISQSSTQIFKCYYAKKYPVDSCAFFKLCRTTHTNNSITCAPNECCDFNENQFVGMSHHNWWSTLSAFAFMRNTVSHPQQHQSTKHLHTLTHMSIFSFFCSHFMPYT